MNRRYLLSIWALATGLFLLAGCSSVEKAATKTCDQVMPNIVIIYADDMGYGDLACQNPDSKIPTPNLDKLAQEGLRFTDGHCSSGICSPSRYALLTGRYHWRVFHHVVTSFGQPRFEPERLTLPEMLKGKGYRTACIGKWHLGWDWNAIKKQNAKPVKAKGFLPEAFDWSKRIPGGPVDQGFDYYFGDGTINFPPYCWIENDRVLEAPTESMTNGARTTQEGTWGFRSGPMVRDWDFYKVLPTLTDKTVEWISQQENDQPFFLYFSLPSPHAPIIPNEEFQGRTEAGDYGDFMFQTDWVAGQVLKALDTKELRDNTIVIFTSDNGPEKYAFERVRRHKHRSMGQLRGLKRDIWEGGHRVPFIVRWPGVIEPGRVSSTLISQIDLMATLAEIIGFDLPGDAAEDSFNQLTLWQDNSDRTVVRREHVHNTFRNEYAFRKDNWILIDHATGSMSVMPDWFIKENNYDMMMPNGGLYNLNEDIGQRQNLIDSFPAKAAGLRQRLSEIRDKGYSAGRFENH